MCCGPGRATAGRPAVGQSAAGASRGRGGKGLYAQASSRYREVIIHGKAIQVPVLRLQ